MHEATAELGSSFHGALSLLPRPPQPVSSHGFGVHRGALHPGGERPLEGKCGPVHLSGRVHEKGAARARVPGWWSRETLCRLLLCASAAAGCKMGHGGRPRTQGDVEKCPSLTWKVTSKGPSGGSPLNPVVLTSEGWVEALPKGSEELRTHRPTVGLYKRRATDSCLASCGGPTLAPCTGNLATPFLFQVTGGGHCPALPLS